jgi:short-subunit dehydrogenase
MAVYYATKAYVLSFTEAIAEETRKTGVTVTAFCPGAFASGFQDVAHAGNTRLIKGRTLPSSSKMAEAALAAMRRGDVVAVPGLVNKIGATSPRFTPRGLVRRVAHFIQREV